MSLNRCEQQLFDYVQRNPEERHYWEQKVRGLAAAQADAHALSMTLDGELWRYLEERARVVAEFRDHGAPGAKRVSLRNLAEYLLRVWVEPKAAAKKRVN
ncbi:hypothetical protein CMV30_13635 [Nibricoccus aquaticus]|uniref:Uncharacterized protein n=1 Tax=Nibricoccus aquaticus TaxID=2576891 RepID=A0A290Q8T6_9BACT|nr:hypothetical protein [Nibricoccus aquaticus]ATC64924.1 hypothetical protein CMV30_13635 [Nibricoccus aquaticus]